MELQILLEMLTSLKKGERVVLTLEPSIADFEANRVLSVGKKIKMSMPNQRRLNEIIENSKEKSYFIAVGQQGTVPWDDFASTAAPFIVRARKMPVMEAMHSAKDREKLKQLVLNIVAESFSIEEVRDYMDRLPIFPEITVLVQRNPIHQYWEVICRSKPGDGELFKIKCDKVGWEP